MVTKSKIKRFRERMSVYRTSTLILPLFFSMPLIMILATTGWQSAAAGIFAVGLYLIYAVRTLWAATARTVPSKCRRAAIALVSISFIFGLVICIVPGTNGSRIVEESKKTTELFSQSDKLRTQGLVEQANEFEAKAWESASKANALYVADFRIKIGVQFIFVAFAYGLIQGFREDHTPRTLQHLIRSQTYFFTVMFGMFAGIILITVKLCVLSIGITAWRTGDAFLAKIVEAATLLPLAFESRVIYANDLLSGQGGQAVHNLRESTAINVIDIVLVATGITYICTDQCFRALRTNEKAWRSMYSLLVFLGTWALLLSVKRIALLVANWPTEFRITF